MRNMPSGLRRQIVSLILGLTSYQLRHTIAEFFSYFPKRDTGILYRIMENGDGNHMPIIGRCTDDNSYPPNGYKI